MILLREWTMLEGSTVEDKFDYLKTCMASQEEEKQRVVADFLVLLQQQGRLTQTFFETYTKLWSELRYPKGYNEHQSGFYVYFLLDPRTLQFSAGNWSFPHEPFYVGKGQSRRYLSDKNIETDKRIAELKALGLEPAYRIIPYANEEDALKAEETFVQKIGRKRLSEGPLLNFIAGGLPNVKFSTSGMPAWNRGRPHPESTKEKISIAMKGKLVGDKNHSKRPEVRKKLSQSAANSWGMLWRITSSDGKAEETTNLSKWLKTTHPSFEYEQFRISAGAAYGFVLEKVKQNQERYLHNHTKCGRPKQ